MRYLQKETFSAIGDEKINGVNRTESVYELKILHSQP